MGKGLFTIIIIVLAGLAILFQAIGLGVTAWKKFHLSGSVKQLMSDAQTLGQSFGASLGGLDGLNGQDGGLDLGSLFGSMGSNNDGSSNDNGIGDLENAFGSMGSEPTDGSSNDNGIGDLANAFGSMGSDTDGSSNDNGIGDLANAFGSMGSDIDGSSISDPFGSNSQAGQNFDMNVIQNVQVSVDINQGLWTSKIEACGSMVGQKMCQPIPSQFTHYMMVDFTTEKYMCLVGILAAVAGTVLLVIFMVSPVDKPMQVVVFCCVAAWVISAVLGFIAVGLGANNENKILEMVAKSFSQTGAHFVCPWAMVMTGIGASFALVVGIVVVLRALQLTNNTKLPGTWNRFTNFAV